MTAAEKGLPAKPLDRSPPEEPIYPDTLLYASGPSASLSADDGSSNRIYPPDEFNQPQSLPPPPRRRSTGLFDWLFGRDEPESDARPEPPPEPEPYPPPRRDDRFRDPYRDR
jgi:hypothetical protein